MNYLSLLLLVFLFSCKHDSTVDFDFSKHSKDKDCIVISCTKCNCILDELNRIQRKDSALLTHFDIFVDKDCATPLLPSIRTVPIEQSALDSISTDIYNMLIISRKQASEKKATIIHTKDADNIEKYLRAICKN